jgi:hypothetical protein
MSTRTGAVRETGTRTTRPSATGDDSEAHVAMPHGSRTGTRVKENPVTALAGWGEVRYLTAGEKPAYRTTGPRAAMAVIAGAAVLGVAGCSSASASASVSAGAAGAAGTACGTTRTAAGVAVAIDVAKGPVNCAAVMRVEAGYAAAIRNGDLRGNGGGAPVAVDGWTCESYSATQARRTGDASECHTANAEVVAVLSLSSSSTSSSAPGSTAVN